MYFVFISLLVILSMTVVAWGIYMVNKNVKTESITTEKNQKPAKKPAATGSLLYKKPGIRVFDIKGLYYSRNLLKANETTNISHVKVEANPHDRYAVSVYDELNQLIGHTPRGNARLNNSLKEWHDGKVLAWGYIHYDDFYKRWIGEVRIPIGLPPETLEIIKTILTLKRENEEVISKEDKSSQEYSDILKRHSQIKSLLEDIDQPEELHYYFPRSLMPKISRQFERDKEWEKLLCLEKHEDLIEDMTGNFKAATLRRIDLAKKNYTRKPK